MKIEEYQTLAMRTSPDGHDRMMNGCMGLIGEAGEVVDVVKKWMFQSGNYAQIPKDKLIEECGDVLWYCAELATGLEESLAAIFTEKEGLFDDLRELNRESSLSITVMRLSAIASRPAMFLYDSLDKGITPGRAAFLFASAKAEIVGVMSLIRDILEDYCGVSLTDAMERNIEKLRKRYPDGFDPERSLHRDEETG